MRYPFLLALFLSSGCGFTTAEPGFGGLLTKWNEVQDHVLLEDGGPYFYNLFTEDVILIPVRVQKQTFDVSASSKDLQIVNSGLAVNFRLDPTKVMDIYRSIGTLEQAISTILDPVVQESFKKTTAKFTAAELITNRAAAKEAVTADLMTTLAKSNVLVTEVSITDFQFDPQYQKAVEAKQIADQKAQQARNDLERIKVEAEQEEARAQGAAKAIILQAEAQAQAQAQALLRSTLTPDLVQLKAVEKWNGVLPQVAGSGTPLLNLTYKQ